jgi:hypothetical protein
MLLRLRTVIAQAGAASTVPNTPIVRLDKLAKEMGINANLLAKLEFFKGELPDVSLRSHRLRSMVWGQVSFRGLGSTNRQPEAP